MISVIEIIVYYYAESRKKMTDMDSKRATTKCTAYRVGLSASLNLLFFSS